MKTCSNCGCDYENFYIACPECILSNKDEKYREHLAEMQKKEKLKQIGHFKKYAFIYITQTIQVVIMTYVLLYDPPGDSWAEGLLFISAIQSTCVLNIICSVVGLIIGLIIFRKFNIPYIVYLSVNILLFLLNGTGYIFEWWYG